MVKLDTTAILLTGNSSCFTVIIPSLYVSAEISHKLHEKIMQINPTIKNVRFNMCSFTKLSYNFYGLGKIAYLDQLYPKILAHTFCIVLWNNGLFETQSLRLF